MIYTKFLPPITWLSLSRKGGESICVLSQHEITTNVGALTRFILG